MAGGRRETAARAGRRILVTPQVSTTSPSPVDPRKEQQHLKEKQGKMANRKPLEAAPQSGPGMLLWHACALYKETPPIEGSDDERLSRERGYLLELWNREVGKSLKIGKNRIKSEKSDLISD